MGESLLKSKSGIVLGTSHLADDSYEPVKHFNKGLEPTTKHENMGVRGGEIRREIYDRTFIGKFD